MPGKDFSSKLLQKILIDNNMSSLEGSSPELTVSQQAKIQELLKRGGLGRPEEPSLSEGDFKTSPHVEEEDDSGWGPTASQQAQIQELLKKGGLGRSSRSLSASASPPKIVARAPVEVTPNRTERLVYDELLRESRILRNCGVSFEDFFTTELSGGAGNVKICSKKNTIIKILKQNNFREVKSAEDEAKNMEYVNKTRCAREGKVFKLLGSESHNLQSTSLSYAILEYETDPHYKDIFRGKIEPLLEVLRERQMDLTDFQPSTRDKQIVARIIGNVIEAVRCLHSEGIVHHDIKAMNIMLNLASNSGAIKMIDFGLSKIIKSNEMDVVSNLRMAGSPFYTAPEAVRGEALPNREHFKIDVWAIGILIIYIRFLFYPYDTTQLKSLPQIYYYIGQLFTEANPDPLKDWLAPEENRFDRVAFYLLQPVARRPTITEAQEIFDEWLGPLARNEINTDELEPHIPV